MSPSDFAQVIRRSLIGPREELAPVFRDQLRGTCPIAALLAVGLQHGDLARSSCQR
jgi:hypothetical protein